MYFKGVYSCKYPNTELVLGFIADNIEQVKDNLEYGLRLYMNRNEGEAYKEWKVIRDYEDFYYSDTYRSYLGSCKYSIEPCSSTDLNDWINLVPDWEDYSHN